MLEREQGRIAEEQERARAGFEALSQGFERGARRTSPPSSTLFLSCVPSEYAAATRVVGPEGGEIVFGAHRLAIPRGALTRPTVITAEAPASDIASVKLSPHGLRFAKSPVLTIDYGHCTVPVPSSETAVYFDDDKILEWPTTTIRGTSALVQIWHFSRYGMATGRADG